MSDVEAVANGAADRGAEPANLRAVALVTLKQELALRALRARSADRTTRAALLAATIEHGSAPEDVWNAP